MKNYYAILLCSLLLIVGCKPQPGDQNGTEPNAGTGKKKDTSPTLYAVPLQLAKNDISRYDSLSRDIFKKAPIKSFTIRSVDLLEAMGMEVSDTLAAEYDHVRIYLGLNKNDEFKLFLTPVDGARLSAKPPVAGVDVILKGDYTGLAEEGDYLLDFSSPCPRTCPEPGL